MSCSKEAVLSGTFPVVPTPFLPEGDIDKESFKRVVRYIIDCGVDGLVFPGLASEYTHLTPQERLNMTSVIGELTEGVIPFVVGASAATPEEAIEYSIAGAKAGAVCAMVMAPLKFADDLAEMVQFYQALADQAQIPIMLQNAPPPMGAGLPVESVKHILSQVPQIEYVKEETMPCGQRIEQLLNNPPSTLKGVFGGAGGRYIIDELNRNALGTVPACELTEVHKILVDAHRRGDVTEAMRAYTNMLPVLNMQAVYRCSLTKEVLLQRGIITSAQVRDPGPRMDRANVEELKELWALVEEYIGPLSTED